MPENPDQSWLIVIVCSLITFAGICVTALASRKNLKSKADEKSVEERLAVQSLEIAKCEKEREAMRNDAAYQGHRIDELNSLALKMSGTLVSDLTNLVKELSSKRK